MTRHAQRWQTALAAIALAIAGASCGGRVAETAPVAAEPRHAPETGLALDPPPAGRLDDTVLPRRASLSLDLDPRTPGFSGRVAIDVELTRPVSTIWLHGSALYLRRIALTAGTRELPLRRIECKEAGAPARCETASGAGLVGLALDEKVGPGPARIDIEYAGRLGARNGLFRQEVDNVWYAFSDFEPTDARLAVPCFDDPRFKIPWQVSMRVPDGMRAFANAPEVSTRPAGKGWRRVEFAPTPPLPTYLLAFAAGPFDVLDGARQPVPMRVIATRGRAAEGAAALAAAAPMLVELERYLGSKTPFPKLDFLAVPTFNGAMENPGLITFAAAILLLQKTAAPRPRLARAPPPDGRRDGPRAGAPLVRRPGHHALVGRAVAQRGAGHLAVGSRDGRGLPGRRRGAARGGRQATGPRHRSPRRAGAGAPRRDSRPTSATCSARSPIARAAPSSPCSRPTSARSACATACAATWPRTTAAR